MKKYEYKCEQMEAKGFMGGEIDTIHFNYGLNELGREGWELVGFTALNRGNGYTKWVMCVFKREVE